MGYRSYFRNNRTEIICGPEPENHSRLILSRGNIPGGYRMPVIILKIRKGLSPEQKRRIVEEFTDTLVATVGVNPSLVTIFIEEHELEDIANAGKLRSDT